MNLSVTNDFAAHIDFLRRLPQRADATLRRFFERGSKVYGARAPGRLDIMGGIGDYSGSLVLEMPIAEAAFAAVQATKESGITVATLNDAADAADAANSQVRVKKISGSQWDALISGSYESGCRYFAQDPASAWAAYVAGTVLVLLRETQFHFSGGLRVLIDSRVPEGKGVSSSAAVEVATMRGASAALGIQLPGEKLARLCQIAENRIVGAPCGIMDQMTSAVGSENELLALRCQPATIEGFVRVPKEIGFWGIDSGVRHSVGGADYASVRCGAFMGYRIIAEVAGLRVKGVGGDPEYLQIDDPTWKGYLANIEPGEFQSRFESAVPTEMSGDEFLEEFGGTTDRVSRVHPGRNYAVRAATHFPIETNQRAERLRTLVQSPVSDESLYEMGHLMFAAHDSYSACGLGSGATDLLVKLVREAGPSAGLYGAKITGGGSGGTVAVLGRCGADDAVAEIARQYAAASGRETKVFRGSSPGSYGTPIQELVI